MKNFLALISTVFVLFFTCSCADINVSYIEKGTYGENLKWTLDTEGTLVIKGKGQMMNYGSCNEIPWYKIRTNITSVIIKKGVTSISDFAFFECENIKTIQLPNSIETIGKDAFHHCNSLAFVELPDSITNIEKDAFCFSGIKEVVLPRGITAIKEGTFNCTELTDIIIPDGVEEIASKAFDESLINVYIPSNIKKLDVAAFYSVNYYNAPLQNSNLKNIYYAGSEEQWNSIIFTETNYGRVSQAKTQLVLPENAMIHYNCKW